MISYNGNTSNNLAWRRRYEVAIGGRTGLNLPQECRVFTDADLAERAVVNISVCNACRAKQLVKKRHECLIGPPRTRATQTIPTRRITKRQWCTEHVPTLEYGIPSKRAMKNMFSRQSLTTRKRAAERKRVFSVSFKSFLVLNLKFC